MVGFGSKSSQVEKPSAGVAIITTVGGRAFGAKIANLKSKGGNNGHRTRQRVVEKMETA